MVNKHLAIVLPAFNEEQSIGQVLDRLVNNENLHHTTIIVVNDGSNDATSEIVASFPRVKLVSHKHNAGLGKTFLTAINYCLSHNVDVMVFFDADGQFKVDEIPKVAYPVLSSSVDFALGSRFLTGSPQSIPTAKLFGNTVLARFISIVMGVKIHDVACGFRAYSREAMLHINVNSKFTYTQEVILDLLSKGLVFKEVPIQVSYDAKRYSTISSNLWRYGWRVLKIITRAIRDYRPMQFFGFIGGVLFLIGLVLDIWLLNHVFQTGAFSPYKIVGFAGAFLNFLGITVWFIGLVADMLNRIRRTQDEVLYIHKKNSYLS